MRIERISIKNYKAIADITIRLNKSLIPIIGINESGKTKILEAILAFMPYNDDMFNGDHLKPKDIYTGRYGATIQAEIVFEDQNEIHQIQKQPSRDDQVRRVGNLVLDRWNKYGRNSIIIERHLPSREFYSYMELLPGAGILESGAETPFTERVLHRLPRITYFEDFVSKIDEKIVFIRTQAFGKQPKLDNLQTLWQGILREIFEHSGIDFNRYLDRIEKKADPTPEHPTLHSEDLEKVNEQLDQLLAREWSVIIGNNDSSNIRYHFYLDRDYQSKSAGIITQHEHIFRFRIRDSLGGEKGTAFNIGDRSKGYQWFCNFILKLVYNPQYARQSRNRAIFLLDEPGAYLHPQAQTRLLDRLIEITRTNLVIYTTHLPQLVNPDKVRIHDCLVAYRDGNRIALSKYGEFSHSQSLGALTTLHHAMKISLPGLMFPNSMIPFALTEGITEFYVFEMVKTHTKLFEKFDVSFVPGHGVGQLDSLISLAIAWSEHYIVIFDKDDAANKAISRYEGLFGEEQKALHWLQIDNQNHDQKVTLEGLFSEADKQKLQNLTNGNLKRAFELLYFSDDADKQAFWDGIDKETEENFAIVAAKIVSLLTA